MVIEKKTSNNNMQFLMDKIVAIHKAGQRLQQLSMPEILAQEIITVLEETVNYEYCAVLLISATSDRLIPFALSDQGGGNQFIDIDKAYIESHDIKIGTGITGWVAKHGETIRLGDVRQDLRYFSLRNNIRSELCVPLKLKDKTIGVVNIETPKLNAYSKFDQLVLETIAFQIAVSIENSSLFKKIKDYTLELENQIKERKIVEKKLNRLAAVIEQATDSIMIADLKGKIEYINPAFEKSNKYSISEIVGKNIKILKTGKQNAEFYITFWDTLKEGKTWSGTLVNRCKNGEIYYEKTDIFPIRDGENNIINYAVIKRDITAEKNLQDQLSQSQKLEAIGQLTSGIAHDFNNLLTAIIGNAEIALMNLSPNTQTHRDIEDVIKSGERAANLVRQLLAFSRKQIIQPQILDINKIISELLKMLRRMINEDINIQYILDPELILIEADPTQVEQILINLIINARDAINQNTGMVSEKEITVETKTVFLDEAFASTNTEILRGRYALLIIKDNGIGMDEQTLEKIFNPFFSTKEQGKGTGLGLSTVYGIVKQNKGWIHVYSEPEKGTAFNIYWPGAKKEIQLKKETSYTRNISKGIEKILIVEDDVEVKKFTEKALISLGYTVISVSNGIEALELVNSNKNNIDLIITDIIMPKVGGKELAINLSDQKSDIKILFTSGYTDNHLLDERIRENNFHFLHKPYTVKKLAETIRAVLDSD